jgi:hypothetical protein
MLRTAIFALLVGTVVAAHASFEMMLLPGADGRIYRYDPVNNIQLGSYRTSTGTTMVSADLGGLSVSSRIGASSFFKHFYSTGLVENAISGTTGSVASELIGDTLFVCYPSLIVKYNIHTGAILGTQSSGSGITYRTMAYLNGQLSVFGVNSANGIICRNVDAATMLGTTVLTLGDTSSAGTNFGKAAVLFNAGTGTGRAVFTYLDSSGLLRYTSLPVLSTGALDTTFINYTTLMGYASNKAMPAFMAGHNSLYLYGQDDTVATNARLTTYDYHVGLITGASTTFAAGGGFSSVLTPYHGAILVAPEPGTMIGLGLGLAAILKRRRKNSAV